MTKRSLHVALLCVAVVPVVAFTVGGWAVITVDDLPDYMVAGAPVNLSFAVRQHGVTLLSSLTPRVTATSGSSEIDVPAAATAGGRYTAKLTLPRAGDWTIKVHSGFMNAAVALVPLKVVEPGPQAPRPLRDAERGLRLFVAKGCVTCHTLEETSAWGSPNMGPVLTGRRYVPEVLATFLADPEKSPLARNTQSQLRMPNLGLKQREIAALVAFINSTGQATSGSPRR
jgi:mono/diheme cytochrome c family protein